MKRPDRRRFRRPLTAGLVSAALLTGAALLADAWVARTEPERRFPDGASVPRRTFAIVPGAKVWPDGQPSDALEDRLETAYDLWRAGKVQRFLVSGNPMPPGRDEVAAMAAWLKAKGVPQGAVIEDRKGLRTLLTMRRAARDFGVRDAIVCTQAFHLPRAVWLARQAGIDAVGVAADRRPYVDAWLDRAREVVARTRALVDVMVLGELR